ncbi:MAG: hypothetical protein IE878_06715, partial [Epsilonproteobacteria bacterium]|nr:hypothetical protein [Campylobacterota bacterium]
FMDEYVKQSYTSIAKTDTPAKFFSFVERLKKSSNIYEIVNPLKFEKLKETNEIVITFHFNVITLKPKKAIKTT